VRTVSGLFDRLCDPDHLDRAAGLTVRGKRRRPDVAWFLFRRQEVLARIGADVRSGSWRPTGFEIVWVRDPKPRVIARASIADRVVHTALATLLEPVLLRSAMPESYACRRGAGTHRAVLRLADLLRRHRFSVHLDVRSYFPSVDLDILRELLAARIRDRPFLAVLDRILEGGADVYRQARVRSYAGLTDDWPPPGRGLPIGAYTSQVLAAHLYLGGLDHFVKRELKVPGYVRYVDDLFLFGDRRADLRAWREAVGDWLGSERGLRLKHAGARILSCAGHLDALGFRIDRDGWRARPRTLRRLRRRTAAHITGRGAGAPTDAASWVAGAAGVVLF
jgi:hypothetical protein